MKREQMYNYDEEFFTQSGLKDCIKCEQIDPTKILLYKCELETFNELYASGIWDEWWDYNDYGTVFDIDSKPDGMIWSQELREKRRLINMAIVAFNEETKKDRSKFWNTPPTPMSAEEVKELLEQESER